MRYRSRVVHYRYHRITHMMRKALVLRERKKQCQRALLLAFLGFDPRLAAALAVFVPNWSVGVSSPLARRARPPIDYTRFQGNDFPRAFVVADVSQLESLCRSLGWNPRGTFRVRGYRSTNLDALAFYLARMGTPKRLNGLVDMLGDAAGSSSRLDAIVLAVAFRIRAQHQHRITWSHTATTQQELNRCAASLQAKGSLVPGLVGFIDGTVHPTCKPKRHQREVYNGHKKK